MIYLTCTNCKATLEMDEAFAGGVCRCQHCGTIQTVPAHLKATVGAFAPVSTGTGAKALYQSTASRSAGAAAPSSGLDSLADVVANSGLSGTGLSGNRLNGNGSGLSR